MYVSVYLLVYIVMRVILQKNKASHQTMKFIEAPIEIIAWYVSDLEWSVFQVIWNRFKIFVLEVCHDFPDFVRSNNYKY